jgi:site-specific recombinase XerC
MAPIVQQIAGQLPPLAMLQQGAATIPAIVAASGPDATERFIEFFTATIRNPNTRRAYGRQVGQFLSWCQRYGIRELGQIRPMMVAAYIEQRIKDDVEPQTVKQGLAAIRMLFDWLVTGQIVPSNPATSVRGPKHSYKTGKTPVLSAADTRALLDSIDAGNVIGLRDRVLIALMTFTFARVGAVTCAFLTTIRTESAGLSGCMRKAASTTSFRFITKPSHISTRSWTPLASVTRAKAPSSAPRAAEADNSPTMPYRNATPFAS